MLFSCDCPFRTNFTDVNGETSAYILQECLFPYGIALALQKNSPFTDRKVFCNNHKIKHGVNLKFFTEFLFISIKLVILVYTVTTRAKRVIPKACLSTMSNLQLSHDFKNPVFAVEFLTKLSS